MIVEPIMGWTSATDDMDDTDGAHWLLLAEMMLRAGLRVDDCVSVGVWPEARATLCGVCPLCDVATKLVPCGHVVDVTYVHSQCVNCHAPLLIRVLAAGPRVSVYAPLDRRYHRAYVAPIKGRTV